MPSKYWFYYVQIVVYLKNTLPTKVLYFDSPYALLYKRNPNYNFFESV